MWKRIWTFLKFAWSLYKNLRTGRDLLKALGVWKVLTLVLSALAAAWLTLWAAIKGLPGPYLVLVFLAAFLLVAAIILVLVLIWKAARISKLQSTQSPLPTAAFAGTLEAELIRETPQVVMLYNPNLSGFQLRNMGTIDALNVDLPAQQKDPFLIKWEAEPNTVPANGDRDLHVAAYDLRTGMKLGDQPVEIIKTVYADELRAVDTSSLTLLKGQTLEVDFKFYYENFGGERFNGRCTILFDCRTETIAVRNTPFVW
ncbi:MAG: hypothetical protein ACJ74Z_13920 [Bryobacteraceae bacterium]